MLLRRGPHAVLAKRSPIISQSALRKPRARLGPALTQHRVTAHSTPPPQAQTARRRQNPKATMDNDAFRKIMATPRPHDSKPQEKFDKKSIRKLVDADLQRSKAGSKKHKREKPAKEKKVDKKKEKKPSKYRDRAEERRTDTNKDYEKDDNIAALEVDAEASKYLGGDVAHTHLVRGLDRGFAGEDSDGSVKAMPPPPPISSTEGCREAGYAISESGSSLLRTGIKVGDGF